MKKVIFVLFIMLLPINVFAVFDVTNPLCTDTLKENLRKDINNIVYVNEKIIDNNITYTLKISQVPSEVYIEYNNISYQDNSFDIKNIAPGTIMSLSMYAKSSSVCSGYKIYTKLIQIPYYNKYKDSKLCVGNEEYFLCKENVNLNVTEEEFNTMIKKYIESKKNNNNEEDNNVIDNNNQNFIDQTLNFIYKYYMYILLSIIFLGSSGIVIILIQKRRNSF